MIRSKGLYSNTPTIRKWPEDSFKKNTTTLNRLMRLIKNKYNDYESTLASHFNKYNDYESTHATQFFLSNDSESTHATRFFNKQRL